MTQFSYPAPPQPPPPQPPRKAKDDSRAIWGVVGGMIGLVLGIGLMTPAVVANVPTDAAPTETVSTAPASPTEAPASPTEEPAETPAKVPHGHRAAAEKAESLLDIFHYSDAELRDELDDRGFTPEEIDYAISQLD